MGRIKKIISLVSWLVFTLIIATLAGYLILIANGYKINYKTLTVAKTGMIYLKSQPEEAKIYLDGQLVSQQTPWRQGDLLPGRYEIKISKDGFVDWEKSLLVEEGKTEAWEAVKLFLQHPQVLEVKEEESQALSQLVEQWPAKGLVIKNGSEIWFNDVYITRFSQDIKNLSWHTDLKHIFLQINKKILVMEADGNNIIELVNLDSEQTSQFVVINEGKELLYQDGEKVKKVRIQ